MSSVKSFNSRGQDPCGIVSVVDAECRGVGAFKSAPKFHVNDSRSTGLFELFPLEQGGSYDRPEMNTPAQGCECNTVIYRYMLNFPAYPEDALIVEVCSSLWHVLLVKTSPPSHGPSGRSFVTGFISLSTLEIFLRVLLCRTGLTRIIPCVLENGGGVWSPPYLSYLG